MSKDTQPPTTEESFAYGFCLLLWALVAFASGSLYAAPSGTQATPLRDCTDDLASLVNPGLMSASTARRRGREICTKLRHTDADYFKAITQ